MASTPTPLVSIITRTKDRHVLLKRALRSVLDQEHTDWEHIIVNDGGNANALDEFLKPYAKEYQGRLKVIHNAESVGMQAASNRALDEAKGKYVGIHDDDDAWRPEFLIACVEYLEDLPEDSPYKGVITHTVRVWEEVDKKGRIVELSRDDYMPLDHVNLFRAGFENPFPPIAFLYHRSVHEEIGRFNPVFDVAGDLDFNVRFMTRYEIGVIPRKLALYHWRRKSRDERLENSVVTEKALHGRKLNEWLNHCLRDGIGKENNQPLGALINTAHVTVAALSRAEEALANLGELKERSDRQTWLLKDSLSAEADLANRLGDLKEHLNTISQLLLGGIEPLLRGSADRISTLEALSNDRLLDLKEHLNSHTTLLEHLGVGSDSRLADLKEHLGSISQLLDVLNEGRLADLKEHLKSQSAILEHIGAGNDSRLADLKEHLKSQSAILEHIGAGSDSRLADLKEHLKSQTAILEHIGAGSDSRLADLKEHLKSQTAILEHIGAGSDSRLADLKEHLVSISNDLAAVARQTAANSEQIEQLKEDARGFSIGPLKIKWRRRSDKKGQSQ